MATLQEFYNNRSMEEGFFPEKLRTLGSLMEKDKTVLDLGCNNGWLGEFLADKFNCVVDGADISSIQIESAKKLRNKYVFDLNDEIWPIDQQYDYVIFIDVIEHIFDTDQFMANARKLVKPEGHIIFSTANVASLGRRWKLLFGQNPYLEVSKHQRINLFPAPAVGHIKYFTLGNMEAMAEFYGFKVEKIVPSSLCGYWSNKIIEKLFPSFCWHIFLKCQKVDLPDGEGKITENTVL